MDSTKKKARGEPGVKELPQPLSTVRATKSIRSADELCGRFMADIGTLVLEIRNLRRKRT